MEHVSQLELKNIVNFFYNFDYYKTDSSQFEMHTRIFTISDQYDIPNLGVLAARKYNKRCNT